MPTTSILLNGTDAYLTLGSSFDFDSDYTILIYCKPTIAPGGTKAVLWGLYDGDSTNSDVYMIHNDGLFELQVTVGNNTIIIGTLGDGTGIIDTWNDIGVRRTSGLYEGFVNGTNLGELGPQDTSARLTANSIAIGAHGFETTVENFMPGNILGFRAWQRSLSTPEIGAETGYIHPQSLTGFWGGWTLDSPTSLSEFTGQKPNFVANGSVSSAADLPTLLESGFYDIGLTSSITPAGSLANEVPSQSFLAGSSTGAGAVARFDLLLDSMKGSTAPVGTISNEQLITTTDRSFTASCSPIGTLHKRTNKHFLAVAVPFRQVSNTKLDIINGSGTITAPGGITNFDMLVDSIHSSINASSTLAPVRIPKPVEILFASSLVAPNAIVKRQVSKHLTASSSAVGTASPNVINTELLSVSGSITPAGNGSYEGIPRSLLDQFFYWLRHHR